MAHSRPVLAFDVGGIPEWLADGVGGLLLPPNDVAALADRLTWMLTHPAEARTMAERGRARVSRDFSASAHLARLLPIYERACRAA
jgi:glycosyltransferase involved in cell wall biosynthesis